MQLGHISRRHGILAGMAIGLGSLLPGSIVYADASATADSNNWFFNKYFNGDHTHTTYWNAANALAATYSEEAQAWNEGGTTGLLTFGPDNKFAAGPTGKLWNTLNATVPAPGTSKATGSAHGVSYLQKGTLWGTNYEAGGFASGTVDGFSIPAGGFGKAYAKLTDPWTVTLPVLPADGTSNITVNGSTFTSSTTDSLNMHAFVDISGSSVSYDPLGSGSLEIHTSIDGINSSLSNYLFDYSFNSSGGIPFSSTLSVASGVSLYLNDYTPTVSDPTPDPYNVNLEFSPSTQVTPTQLKAYLDGFASTSGWSAGSTPVLVGMQFDIPDSAPGVTSDSTNRYFAYHDDVTAIAQDAAVPEPAGLAAILLISGASLTRRRRV